MEKTELKDAFAEFKNLKNIDRPTMMGVLEDVLGRIPHTACENIRLFRQFRHHHQHRQGRLRNLPQPRSRGDGGKSRDADFAR